VPGKSGCFRNQDRFNGSELLQGASQATSNASCSKISVYSGLHLEIFFPQLMHQNSGKCQERVTVRATLSSGWGMETSGGIQSINIGTKYKSRNTTHLAGESKEKKGWGFPH
jgi:hypothetical protein